MIKAEKITIALSLLLTLFSCGQKEPDKDKISDYYQSDTIQVSGFVTSSDDTYGCPDLLKSYYVHFGIVIQRYYDIEDSLFIDINKDGIKDVLIVLSPVPLEDTHRYDCLINNASDRLVVEVIKDKKGVRVRNVYSNLVSNIGGVLSKYNGITLTENGFEIHHQSGSRYSWEYIAEYSTHSKDSLALIRIKKTCSLDDMEKSEEYFYNDHGTQRMNIHDIIGNNCSCDSIWNTLEGE